VAQRDLVADPQAPRLTRRWAAEVLRRWELDSELDRALLVLNELVTNALVHSPGEAACRLTVDAGTLEIVVNDAGTGPPRRALRAATVTEQDEWERSGGRGLQIVAAVADTWGAAYDGGRAGVWARWALAPGWSYAERCVCGHPDGAAAVPLASGGTAVAMPGPWDDGPTDPVDLRAEWFAPSSPDQNHPG
jgi:anti-sigma regulatory factor (Ser/Thr protein kinase)